MRSTETKSTLLTLLVFSYNIDEKYIMGFFEKDDWKLSTRRKWFMKNFILV